MKTIKQLAKECGGYIETGENDEHLEALCQAYMQDRLSALEPLGVLAQESFGRGQIFWFKEAPKDGTKVYDISTLKEVK